MKTNEFCKSVKLAWNEVGKILAEYIGSIFNRMLMGFAKGDDYCYWDFSSKNYAFSISEIYAMIHHVNGGSDMCEDSIPIEDNASHSIGHILSCALWSQLRMYAHWRRVLQTKRGKSQVKDIAMTSAVCLRKKSELRREYDNTNINRYLNRTRKHRQISIGKKKSDRPYSFIQTALLIQGAECGCWQERTYKR